jgi:hypothetical protein
LLKYRMCGFSGSTASTSALLSDPSPPELIDVVTSSVATTGDDTSPGRSCTSAAQWLCTSPVSTTALRTAGLFMPATMRSRLAG